MPEINPLSILLTIIGGLIVAALLGWIRKPRLVTLMPRTFSYSHITDKGQLVEISVFNRGLKTEENIDVTLNHSYSYELLGANSQDVLIDKNRIKISRIGPSDEITTLIIVEGGIFKTDDIFQTLSKETKGNTVSKLEEVSPTGPQRIILVALFLVLPIFLYVGYISMNKFIGSISAPLVKKEVTSAIIESEIKKSIQGWNVPRHNVSTAPKLFSDFESKKISAEIGTPSINGNVISLPVLVSNKTDGIIKYDLSMTTIASEKKIMTYDRKVSDVIVIPSGTEKRKIDVIIDDSLGEAGRTVFIELWIESMRDGESLQRLTQEYIYK
ncbi:hypothetical protein [Aeromonas sobria]|uniref:hypothetical protein n=1 Tax=Aeromonas sobria TaxID=646 RepID=UPI001117A404|nr:hypothetical protein [Aeromonas sobria]